MRKRNLGWVLAGASVVAACVAFTGVTYSKSMPAGYTPVGKVLSVSGDMLYLATTIQNASGEKLAVWSVGGTSTVAQQSTPDKIIALAPYENVPSGSSWLAVHAQTETGLRIKRWTYGGGALTIASNKALITDFVDVHGTPWDIDLVCDVTTDHNGKGYLTFVDTDGVHYPEFDTFVAQIVEGQTSWTVNPSRLAALRVPGVFTGCPRVHFDRTAAFPGKVWVSYSFDTQGMDLHTRVYSLPPDTGSFVANLEMDLTDIIWSTELVVRGGAVALTGQQGIPDYMQRQIHLYDTNGSLVSNMDVSDTIRAMSDQAISTTNGILWAVDVTNGIRGYEVINQ